ncbi:hypothetical protein CMI37_18800 [Candidatus Pacearchaeota archaeon]|nr:hypothetical protein [Candidatus Pacearchaeota archaeon]|tara:strand:+ start:865 stop:1908 length:1044 start_codon:yes stop_codon:yes gene_type:complete
MHLPEPLWNGEENPSALSERRAEVWAQVVAGYYISNLGRFWHGRLLRGSISQNGYRVFTVFSGGSRKSTVAHRMVLKAFVGPPPTSEHTDARHLNGDKADNRLCNLAWGTRSENMLDVVQHRKAGLEHTPVQSEGPTWFRGYTPDDYLVGVGLQFFHDRKLTTEDLCLFWRCSRDTAQNILGGRTRQEVPRPEGWKNSYREGETHHKASVSDKDLEEALALYTRHRWSGVRFAGHLGIKQITAHSILKGRTRASVPRPPGFQYPWPKSSSRWAARGEAHPATALTEEKILEAFELVMKGKISSYAGLGEHLRLSKSATHALVKGKSWPGLDRPKGLEDRLRVRKSSS